MTSDAVIFDLDGTLADTLEDLGDSLNRVLARQGLPPRRYAAVKYMVGNGIRRLVTDALPLESRSDDLIATCLERFMADYEEHCLVKTRLYDGIAELLSTLRADGVKMAVFSNKADGPTRRIVDALIGSDTFVTVVGAQPGIPLKPDPAGALMVAERLGVAPHRIAYLGDSAVDMRTAAAAGMMPIGVAWGFRTRDELAESGAEAVLDHPLELLELRLLGRPRA